jgi:hypothetical protein
MRKGVDGGQLLLPAGLLVATMLLAAASTVGAQGPRVRVELPSTQAVAVGESFTVSVVAQDVANLGAFEFDLSYDAGVLTPAGVKEGPFLASSGRQVECLPPRTQKGLIGLTCVSLGATPDGPSGSGVLAEVSFQAVAPGSSPLQFARLTLTDPPGQLLPAEAQDTTLTVAGDEGSATNGSEDGGFSWSLWGPVIGAVAVALLAAGGFAWWTRRSQQP